MSPVRLTWVPTRGMYHRVQTSTGDFGPGGWSNASPFLLFRANGAVAGDPAAEWIDNNPAPGAKFYRIARSFSP